MAYEWQRHGSPTMDLAAATKRFFPIIPLVLLGCTAYLQARGVAHILGAAILHGGGLIHDPQPGHGARSTAISEHNTNARSIIERNPFDSVKGNLDPSPTSSSRPGEVSLPSTENPYAAPPCAGARLLASAMADEPAESFAFLSGGPGEGSGSKRIRQYDPYAGKTVWFIRADRVWLIGESEFCQVEMYTTAPSKPAASTSTAGSLDDAAPKTPPKKTSPIVTEIVGKIQKKSDTSFAMPRAVLDKIIENQAELIRGVQAVPEKENGQVSGVRITGLKPESVLSALGVQNGDRLQTINGYDLGNPEKAIEAMAKLRTADRMGLVVQRGGKQVSLDVAIQ